MKKSKEFKKVCNSWYHQRWFRILLIIVGVDMIVFGVLFGLGINVWQFVLYAPSVVRLLGGLMYVLVALYLIHHAMSYQTMKEKMNLVCHHCACGDNKHTEKA